MSEVTAAAGTHEIGSQDRAFLSSQEKLEKKKTVQNRNRIGREFDQFLGQQKISLELVKKFMHDQAKDHAYAPTTLSNRLLHLKKYIHKQYSVVYSDVELQTVSQWIQKKSEHHKKKKSSIFTQTQIITYLKIESEELTVIRAKLILVFGVFSLGRMEELSVIEFNDVKETKQGIDFILNRVKATEDHKSHRFIIPRLLDDVNLVDLFNKYKKLVPQQTGRVWRRYYPHGGFGAAPLGKSTCSEVTCSVATSLGLSDLESYTGHDLRATGCVLMYLAGATLIMIMRAGNWASEAIILEYIRNCDIEVEQRAAMIAGLQNQIPQRIENPAPQPIAPIAPQPAVQNPVVIPQTTEHPTYNFAGATFSNCTFNFK